MLIPAVVDLADLAPLKARAALDFASYCQAKESEQAAETRDKFIESTESLLLFFSRLPKAAENHSVETIDNLISQLSDTERGAASNAKFYRNLCARVARMAAFNLPPEMRRSLEESRRNLSELESSSTSVAKSARDTRWALAAVKSEKVEQGNAPICGSAEELARTWQQQSA